MIKKLLSPEVQKFIKDHLNDDPFLLTLNSKAEPSFPLTDAIQQIESHQKALGKLDTWISKENIIWPPPISIEQASSDITAQFKSSLIYGKSIADLTGGSGIDTFYFAEQFEQVHYVESNDHLCEQATHNFEVLERKNIKIHNKTAEEFLRTKQRNFDAIFVDPSRRNKDKKVFKIEDCSPNLVDILPGCLEAAPDVLLKLSPLVDISALLKTLSPNFIWVVGVKNEVKEVLCLVQRSMQRCRIEAVMLGNGEGPIEFKFFLKQEKEANSEYSFPKKFIYEPNASIMKAGAFKLIGKHFGLYKLHKHTHLYTTDELVENFPGRIFEIKKQIKPNKKEILESFPDKKVNIITRNYPLSSNKLKSKFQLRDGGDDFLIATTSMDGKKVLLKCERTI